MVKKNYIIIIYLALFCFIIYFNTLKNGFVFDDLSIITQNGFIKNWTRDPGFFFDKTYFIRSVESSYRPVATLSYFVNYLIWKENPLGYHLSSLIFHILNVILVFFLFSRIFKNKLSGLIAGLIFACHPVLTEAINCITFNDDIIACLFFLTAFLFYSKISNSKEKKNIFIYIISLAFYFIALLSKEMAITLPAIVILFDLLIKDDINKIPDLNQIKNIIQKRICYYTGYAAVSLFYLIIRFKIMTFPVSFKETSYGSLFRRIIYLPYNLFYYVRLAIFPHPLNADVVFSYPENFFDIMNLISFLVFFIIILITIMMIKKNQNKILFGILFFFISLLPVLNLIEITHPLAERYLYLPLVSFCAVFAAIISGKPVNLKVLKNSLSQFKFSLLFIIVLIFSALTAVRNHVWQDNFTLWGKTLQASPGSFRAHNGYGISLIDKGRYEEAKEHFIKAVKLYEGDPDSHHNLGIVYSKIGDYENAAKEFNRSIEINPYFTYSYNSLANIFYAKGMYKEAEETYKKSISFNPDHALSYFNLGCLYSDRGFYNDAINMYNVAIKINPDYIDAYINLGMAYGMINDYENAVKALSVPVKLNPGSIDVLFQTGYIYVKIGLIDRAVDAYEEVIKIDPQYYNAYFNLGIIYSENKMYEQAISQFIKAIEINPNIASMHFYFARTLIICGKNEEALNELIYALKLEPDNIPVLIELGKAYINLKRIKEAHAVLKTALDIEPENKEAKDLLKKF